MLTATYPNGKPIGALYSQKALTRATKNPKAGIMDDDDGHGTYCAAVEARYGADAIAADPDAAQWLELAREHAARAQQLPRLPADPEITHDGLKPYLGGWSPYGPHRW